MADDEGLVVLTSGPRNMVEKGLTGAMLLCIGAVLVVSAAQVATSHLCSARSKGWQCTSRLHKFFQEAEVSEGTSAIVQHRLRELRMSMMQTLMKMVFVGFIPWDLDLLNNLVRGTSYIGTTAEGEILGLALQCFCGVPFLKPSWLPPRRLNLVLLVLWSLVTVQMTPFICCTVNGSLRNFVGCLFFILLLNVVAGLASWRDLLLLTLANLVFTGCWTYSWWSVYRHTDPWQGIAIRSLTWHAITVTLGLLSAVLEAGSRKLLIQGLQLAEVQERHNAATALLRSIYDVVVELDSGGCVVGTSRDLGSLLLRADPIMAGVQLAGLILDEADRKTFQRRLAAPRPKHVGLAENMHVSMKDSLGNTLRMEMMWFACDRADGTTHSIVGIREFSDQAQAVSDEGPGAPHAPDYFPSPGGAEDAGDGEGSSASEDTSSLPQTQAETIDNVDVVAEQAMAVIDMTREDHPVRAITTGFRANVGHVSRNAPLARIVKRPRPMVAWLESAVNSAENGEPQPSDHKVSLRLPQGKLVALCRLVLTEGGDSASPPVDAENVVVLFHNVRLVTRRTAGDSHPQAELRGTPANASPASLGGGSESL